MSFIQPKQKNAAQSKELAEEIIGGVIPGNVFISKLLEKSAFISTNVPELDSMMKGGIKNNCVTEIIGGPGEGKTQMCLLIISAGLNTNPSSHFIYIDNGTNYNARRLENMNHSLEQVEKQVRCIEVIKFTELIVALSCILEQLNSAQSESIKNLKAIFIDSIHTMCLISKDFTTYGERMDILQSIMKKITKKHFVPIIVSSFNVFSLLFNRSLL